MNVAFFLKPKSEVCFLYDDTPLRQALTKLRSHGYVSVPVIDHDGKYVNTVGEGDFLWHILPEDTENRPFEVRNIENLHVSDVLRRDKNPSCPISEPIEELLMRSTSQNFIPIVDDRGIFIGIVTRRGILDYFLRGALGGD